MLDIFHINNGFDWDLILKKYGPSEVPSGHENVLKNIFDYLKDSCKTVIIESQYIDRDFRLNHSAFYSQMFNPPNYICDRIHFFSNRLETNEEPDPGKILDFLQNSKKTYLGFSVITPTLSNRVGRTIISPIKLQPNQYITCKSKHEANIFGVQLSVVGMPFCEQDGHVARCAEVSLRNCVLHMHKIHDLRDYLTDDIAGILTEKSSGRRTLPSNGLSVGQMEEALKRMGYNPLVFAKKEGDAWDPSGILYPYIESGVPVIIFGKWEGREFHAEIVVGHSSNYSPQLIKKNNRHPVCAKWVDGLFINDDTKGPYRYYSKKHKEVKGIEKLIVPLPPKIFLSPTHVEEYVDRLLNTESDTMAHLKNSAKKSSSLKNFLQKELDKVILHVFFCNSNALKESLSKRRTLAQPVRETLQFLNMPRYVWVVELTTHSHWYHEERQILGQFIFDTTSNRFWKSLLVQHLPGYIQANDFKDSTNPVKVIVFDKDEPYSPFCEARN